MTILLPGSSQIAPPGGGERVTNGSTAVQTPVAAARTYLAGSALAVPDSGLKVGSRLRWKLNMTKTAAGTAASTFDIAVGTTGTTTDVAKVSFAKPAGTAAIDEGLVEVECVVKAIGAAGVLVGEFTLIHNLAATGHATIPCVVVSTIATGVDLTASGLILGLCLTTGAADAITIDFVEADLSGV